MSRATTGPALLFQQNLLMLSSRVLSQLQHFTAMISKPFRMSKILCSYFLCISCLQLAWSIETENSGSILSFPQDNSDETWGYPLLKLSSRTQHQSIFASGISARPPILKALAEQEKKEHVSKVERQEPNGQEKVHEGQALMSR